MLLSLLTIGGVCPTPGLATQETSAAFVLTATSVGNGYPDLPLLEKNHFYRKMNIIGSGGMNDFSYHFSLYGQTGYEDQDNRHAYHLNSFQGEFKTPSQYLRLGETYTQYSSYSLTHSVKGGVYSYISHHKKGPEFSVIYGLNCSDWDQFWGKTTTRRQVKGLRYKQPLTSDFWIAANLVQTRDHQGKTEEIGYESSVISLDWSYQLLDNLVLYGETAFADTATISTSNEADGTEHKGTAQRINAQLKRTTTDFVLTYERISSDFVSLVTDTTADREKLSGRLTYQLGPLTEYTLSLLWYHDDLAGQLDYRTDHYQPRVALSRKQIFNRPHARLDSSYTYKRSESTNTGQNHHYVSVTYLDHFGAFVSCSNLNLIFYDNTGAAHGDEYTYNTSLTSSFAATPNIKLKPELRLGGWMIDDELNDSEKQVWEYSLGLGITIPNRNFETHLRIGQNQLIDANDENVAKLLASINLNYLLKKSRHRTTQVYLQGYVNDYSYTTASNNYSEINFSSGLNITF